MFFNDHLLLQCVMVITIIYISFSTSPMTLWILGFFLLATGGLWGLNLNLTVLIGFLWVIDLGVGLIFLIFLASLTVFGETSLTNEMRKNRMYLSLLVASISLISASLFSQLESVMSLHNDLPPFNSLINYYMLFNDHEISQLNLLREIFFYNNAWEFIIINYVVLFGLIGLVIFNFILTTSNTQGIISQLFSSMRKNNVAPLFIRDQNFLSQQQTSSSTRLWQKRKLNLKK